MSKTIGSGFPRSTGIANHSDWQKMVAIYGTEIASQNENAICSDCISARVCAAFLETCTRFGSFKRKSRVFSIVNRPISLSAQRVRDVAITLDREKPAVVHDAACAVSGSTLAKLQRRMA